MEVVSAEREDDTPMYVTVRAIFKDGDIVNPVSFEIMEWSFGLASARRGIRDLPDGSYDILKVTNLTPYVVSRETVVKVEGGETAKRKGGDADLLT